jgi:uncharacterized protein YcbX
VTRVATVARLSIAPVKGLGLLHPDEVRVGPRGVAENRRFWLIDADGRRYALLRDGRMALVRPHYDATLQRLALAFPDGSEASGEIAVDGPVVTDFYGRGVPGRLVEGPWSEALSEYAGRPLRLVQADAEGAALDRSRGAISILSMASLDELARQSNAGEVDDRRFRMLFTIDGVEAHEEDAWAGREVRVGEARVRIVGNVARCAITTQNPDTGDVDFDTLREIKAYRGAGAQGKDIDFGVFGEVVEPGRVCVGDTVEPL